MIYQDVKKVERTGSRPDFVALYYSQLVQLPAADREEAIQDLEDLNAGEKAGLAFSNVPLPPETGGAESTRVGLVSVRTMMEKMHAEVRVSQTDREFCITLFFPVLPSL